MTRRIPRTNAAWVLGLLVCMVVGALIPTLVDISSGLALVTVCCIPVYALLVVRARRECGRWLGLVPIIAVLWVIYYPVRLLVIQLNRDDELLHPAMRLAVDSDLIWVWIVSTAGLAMLLFGASVPGRVRLVRAAPIDQMQRPAFMVLAIVGLVVTFATLSFGVSSGIASNIGPILLIGIGGMGFLDARRGRTSYRSIALVAIALIVGALSGFKELAALPAAAWGIGLIAGRQHALRPRTVLAVTVIVLLGYVGVAGQRIAAPLGEPTDLPRAALNALTRYDLARGTVRENGNHGWGIVSNVSSSFSRRTSGVEALIILRGVVPSQVHYQGGRTLALPTLTLLPGSAHLTGDSPFSTLSLGRYYSQNFYSLNPDTDPSAQAITWAGDLYLNFGAAGILVGLFVIGAMVGIFDRRYPPTSAFNAGVIAFAGTQVIGLERNVAYVVVTVVIRLAIASAVHWALLGAWSTATRLPSTNQRTAGPRLVTVGAVERHLP